jgi:hypothetical protein
VTPVSSPGLGRVTGETPPLAWASGADNRHVASVPSCQKAVGTLPRFPQSVCLETLARALKKRWPDVGSRVPTVTWHNLGTMFQTVGGKPTPNTASVFGLTSVAARLSGEREGKPAEAESEQLPDPTVWDRG